MSRVSSRRCSGLAIVPSLDDGQKQADRLLALATDRLMDRRERGVDVLGEVDVVEADDADIAGDGESHVTQRAHRTDRHRVAHGQHRVGRWPSSQAPFMAAIPPSIVAGPTTTRSSGMSIPTLANASR